MKKFCVSIISSLCFVAGPFVNAGELGATLFTGIEFSDNITRNNTDDIDDFELRYGADIEYVERSKALTADANLRIEALDYVNDTFDDEVSLTTGLGVVNLNIVENLLDWNSSYRREEILVGVAVSDTRENREIRGVLSTGPRLSFRPTVSSSMSLSVNYINAQNTGDFISDSERLDSRFDYLYGLNSLTDLSLALEYEDLFEISSDRTYKQFSFALGGSRRVARGELSLMVGKEFLDPAQGESEDSDYVDVTYQQERVWQHDIEISYVRSVSDSSVGSPVSEVNDDTEQALDDSRSTREDLEILIAREFESFSYAFEAYASAVEYDLGLVAEDSFGAGLDSGFNVNADLNLGFRLAYDQTDYGAGLESQRFGVDETLTYELNSGFDMARDLSVTSFIRYEDRTNKYVDSRESQELRVGASIRWELFD